jgi:hypothetical protein
VVQHIEVNGTVVNQYFYETFCTGDFVYETDEILGTTIMRAHDDGGEPSAQKCTGIDESVSFDPPLFVLHSLTYLPLICMT